MKPPHGNRPGGSNRPPSDRGPYRGPGGGHGRRPHQPGGGQAAQDGGRHRGAGGPRPEPGAGHAQAGNIADPAHRDHASPGRDAPRHDPPRHDPPRHDAPRHDRPHQNGGGKLGLHGAPRGEFDTRPPKPTHGATLYRSPQRHHDGPRGTPDAPKGTLWLYGHHAVAAALANPNRRLRRLQLTEEAEAAIGKHLPPPWAVSPERVDRARLDHLLGRDVAHQGAALLADPLAPPSLQSVLEKPGVIIVLDQVTDPRNVGAIMRSAAAFGAAAVITQDRNAPEETGGLAKAASGALETMPLLRAVNIARTIIALKAANVWCIGLDAAGAPLSGPAFADRRVALVLGAEGEGLRRLTRETCDEIAGLTIKGAVESLNVSAAASVALYELSRR